MGAVACRSACADGGWFGLSSHSSPGISHGGPREDPVGTGLAGGIVREDEGVVSAGIGLKDEWRGRIDLIINSALPADREPLLTAVHRPGGWNYELELPKNIREEILVQAMMQAMLTELVNRRAGSHSAEIPFWLVQGMSAHLQAYNMPTFIIRPNVQSAGYAKLGIEGLNAVRAPLREHTPLSFQQLSWPQQSNVTGNDQAVYRGCAELFFESLLHLDDGQSCLQQMLQEMPNYMNWQTAFLAAFHSHFARLLDVEKWWSLNCVSFTSSELTEHWTEQECWHKLQDALDVPVAVHFAASRMPTEARVTLQDVITQWDGSNALAALQRTVRGLKGLQLFTFRGSLNLDASAASPLMQHNLQDLEALQWRISKELSPLITDYLVVLLNYVKQSQPNAQLASDEKSLPSRLRVLKSDTVRQLNNLDQKRAQMRVRFSPVSHPSELSALDARGANGSPVPQTPEPR